MLQEVKFLDYNTYLMVMSTVFCEKGGVARYVQHPGLMSRIAARSRVSSRMKKICRQIFERINRYRRGCTPGSPPNHRLSAHFAGRRACAPLRLYTIRRAWPKEARCAPSASHIPLSSRIRSSRSSVAGWSESILPKNPSWGLWYMVSSLARPLYSSGPRPS